MFAPPPSVQASVFTRIPQQFWLSERRSLWTEVQRHGAAAPTFLEGPAFDREGYLWVTDIPWGRIFRIGPDGSVALAASYDGEPNGLAFHRDGRCFIADMRRGLMVLDPASGAVKPVIERPQLEPFRGLNDLAFASNGDLYFTDQGQTGLNDPSGRLYRLSASGRLDIVLDRIPSPNGLVLSRDERTVFLAVTRDNAVWRVPLTKDGAATKVGVFIRMSGGAGPDGLALDRDGNLAVAHVGLGSVWLFSSVGEPLLRIHAPEGVLTTNCAFGGPDGRHLFITESTTGSVLSAPLEVAGQPLFSHAEGSRE